MPRSIASAYEAAILNLAEKHKGKLRRPVGLAWGFGALVRRSWASRAEKGVLRGRGVGCSRRGGRACYCGAEG